MADCQPQVQFIVKHTPNPKPTRNPKSYTRGLKPRFQTLTSTLSPSSHTRACQSPLKDVKFIPLMYVTLGFGSQIPLLRAIFHGLETQTPGVQTQGTKDKSLIPEAGRHNQAALFSSLVIGSNGREIWKLLYDNRVYILGGGYMSYNLNSLKGIIWGLGSRVLRLAFRV